MRRFPSFTESLGLWEPHPRRGDRREEKGLGLWNSLRGPRRLASAGTQREGGRPWAGVCVTQSFSSMEEHVRGME